MSVCTFGPLAQPPLCSRRFVLRLFVHIGAGGQLVNSPSRLAPERQWGSAQAEAGDRAGALGLWGAEPGAGGTGKGPPLRASGDRSPEPCPGPRDGNSGARRRGAGITSPRLEAGSAPEARPPACSVDKEPQAGGLRKWGVSSRTPTWPHLTHSSGPGWLRLGSTLQCFRSEFPLCSAPCRTFQKLPREATPRPVPLATMAEEGTWAHRWS